MTPRLRGAVVVVVHEFSRCGGGGGGAVAGDGCGCVADGSAGGSIASTTAFAAVSNVASFVDYPRHGLKLGDGIGG